MRDKGQVDFNRESGRWIFVYLSKQKLIGSTESNLVEFLGLRKC